jgi:hypothetical protein
LKGGRRWDEGERVRRAGLVIAFVAGALACAPARATTGSELLANCTEVIKGADGATSDPYKAGQCMGFLQGFGAGVKVSALGASSNLEEYEKRRFYCLPEKLTNLQLARVIVDALRHQSEERLQEEAGVLVGLELRRAFPCKAGRAGEAPGYMEHRTPSTQGKP